MAHINCGHCGKKIQFLFSVIVFSIGSRGNIKLKLQAFTVKSIKQIMLTSAFHCPQSLPLAWQDCLSVYRSVCVCFFPTLFETDTVVNKWHTLCYLFFISSHLCPISLADFKHLDSWNICCYSWYLFQYERGWKHLKHICAQWSSMTCSVD